MTADRPGEPRQPGWRRTLALTLAVACLLTAAAVVALGVWVFRGTSEESQDDQDRLEVIQATERFVETWNTFTPENADAYVDQVAPLLSTKFRAEFTKEAENVLLGIEQQKLSSEGEVLVDNDGIPLVGIASIDPDSAETLVVADAQRVASGQQVVRHWRWQVSLVKVDGEWLVDEFKEV